MNIFLQFYNRHKLLLQFIFITIVLLFFTIVFRESFYSDFGYKNYISNHLIIEIFIVLVSLAIAVQTWLAAKFTQERRIILLGALFLIFGVLEMLHALTYSGMPFFITELNPNMSLWFSTIPRLLLSVGFILFFSFKNKAATTTFRNTTFLGAAIISLLVIFILYHPSIPIANLFTTEGEPTPLKNNLHILSIFLQVLAILAMLRHMKKTPRETAAIIVALIYLIGSDLMYLSYQEFYDMYIFLAHVLHLFAFILLFSAIYYSQVRLPFRELKSALTTLAQSEKKIRQMAYYDKKTALPNEYFLKEDLRRDLEERERPIAILIFGINRYDTVKSTLGEKFSDRLIIMIGERITTYLNGKYPIYKLDEDRFAVYILDYNKGTNLEAFTSQLQQAVARPFMINHFSISTHLFFGVSLYPQDTDELDDLIQYASFATYEAQKRSNHFAFYTLEMQKKRQERIKLENDLKEAINGQLFLEYQPQLDLKTGRISSIEALIRWRHPERGLIAPYEFIPIAEESGLIIPIGQWVMETACLETMKLRRETGKDISVAVNLSMGQLYQQNLVSHVEIALEKSGLPPENLQLEITETMTMNTRQITPVLQNLKDLGVSIAVDDFGKEYSSLSYLKDFPLDVLKIDRCFIQNILDNEKDIALVKMILSMARHLQVKVVAEGIENVEQLHCLIHNQCDIIQGFYISRPLPIHKLNEKLDGIQAFAMENLKGIKK